MQKSYCYTPGIGVHMQNVGANVNVLKFQSFCIFSCILSLLTILIKPLTTKAYDRRAYGDCGTSGWLWSLTYFWKTLTLAITFKSEMIRISYCTCIFLVTRPFTWCHNFYAPCLKSPTGASSNINLIIHPSVRLFACLSVILSRLQSAIFKVWVMIK